MNNDNLDLGEIFAKSTAYVVIAVFGLIIWIILVGIFGDEEEKKHQDTIGNVSENIKDFSTNDRNNIDGTELSQHQITSYCTYLDEKDKIYKEKHQRFKYHFYQNFQYGDVVTAPKQIMIMRNIYKREGGFLVNKGQIIKIIKRTSDQNGRIYYEVKLTNSEGNLSGYLNVTNLINYSNEKAEEAYETKVKNWEKPLQEKIQKIFSQETGLHWYDVKFSYLVSDKFCGKNLPN